MLPSSAFTFESCRLSSEFVVKLHSRYRPRIPTVFTCVLFLLAEFVNEAVMELEITRCSPVIDYLSMGWLVPVWFPSLSRLWYVTPLSIEIDMYLITSFHRISISDLSLL